MPVFPQITSYPLIRQLNLRTLRNESADGSTVTYSDSYARVRAWELEAKGLTGAEWTVVEAFFRSVSGPWQTFTFLDPAGNLLADSEDFGTGAWTNGPLIQLTAGAADPFGTTRATRAVNSGQAAQAVAQTLQVPGNYEYAMSVWARTSAGSNLTLNAANESRTFPLTTQWQRISFSVNPGQNTAAVTFSAQLDPGASADLFGMQVDAQKAPSEYKKTGTNGGVYLKARFAANAFTVTARSTDVYDASIRIVSTEI